MDKEIKEVISKHTEESDRLIGSSISANRAINILQINLHFYRLVDVKHLFIKQLGYTVEYA